MSSILEIAESRDVVSIVTAIKGAAQSMRGEPRASADEATIRAIVALASHAEPEVRQTVAEAAVDLPEEAFEAVITRLLDDPEVFVKRAAQRSYKERSRRQRLERTREDRTADVLRIRTRMKDVHGEKVLRLADKLSDNVVRQIFDGLDHEVSKLTLALKGAIGEVRTAANGGRFDRLHVLGRLDHAGATLDILLGVVESAKGRAQIAAPSYKDESLRAIVETQLELLRARIGEGRVRRLRVEVAIDPSLKVEVDRVLLAQAVANLLQNAVEAYPLEGDAPIALAARAEPRSAGTVVALVVEDRGCGIDAPDLVRVGEAFMTSKGTGRGLGVANVKRMIEVAHGGTVHFESKRGEGTTVTVTLPRKQTTRDAE